MEKSLNRSISHLYIADVEGFQFGANTISKGGDTNVSPKFGTGIQNFEVRAVGGNSLCSFILGLGSQSQANQSGSKFLQNFRHGDISPIIVIHLQEFQFGKIFSGSQGFCHWCSQLQTFNFQSFQGWCKSCLRNCFESINALQFLVVTHINNFEFGQLGQSLYCHSCDIFVDSDGKIFQIWATSNNLLDCFIFDSICFDFKNFDLRPLDVFEAFFGYALAQANSNILEFFELEQSSQAFIGKLIAGELEEFETRAIFNHGLSDRVSDRGVSEVQVAKFRAVFHKEPN
mmetsp:Transcript_25800/g.36288  ORF Transcript_25800/g.36288 Transcript_25800/m.36288 type:complete len:287 (-) Transcript_25800:322-1182(-)